MDLVAFVTVIPLWSILIVISLVALYIYGTRSLDTWSKLGVPGPKPLPFIGNVHQIMLRKQDRLGRSCEGLFSKYGKIFGVYVFNKPALMIKDQEALKDVLVKNFNNFTDRHYIPDAFFLSVVLKGLAFQGGHEWKRSRQLVTPSFSVAKLKSFARFMNTKARKMTAMFKEHADEDRRAASQDVFNAFSFDIITGTGFSFNVDAQNLQDTDLMEKLNKMFAIKPSLVFGLFIAFHFPFLDFIVRKMNLSFIDMDSTRYMAQLIHKCIIERKADNNNHNTKYTDLLQSFLHAEIAPTSDSARQWFSTEDLIGQIGTVLIAGYETTSKTLQFITYNLAKNPDIQDSVVDEIKKIVGDEDEISYEKCHELQYIEAVVLETLRMYPPAVTLFRKAVRTTTLKRFTVPEGTVIFANLFRLGRDPEIYEDPETFDPNRFYVSSDNAETGEDKNDTKNPGKNRKTNSLECLSFGLGPRHCVGMKYAMMEIKIALVHLLKRFVLVEASPDVLELDDINGILGMKTPIKLRVAHRGT